MNKTSCLLFLQLMCIILVNGVSVAADDYFDNITVASDGRLTRFTQMPLTIYLAPIPLSEVLKAEYIKDLEEAIALWERASDGKLKFKWVEDFARADIRVSFAHKPTQLHLSNRVGEANLVRVGKRFHVEIEVVLRDLATLKFLNHGAVKTVILHELGHAVGLWGHSPYAEDVMYFEAITQKPTKRDIATLKKVYSTPPDTAFHHIAIAILKDDLAEHPNDAQLHHLLGTIYADQMEYDMAVGELQKALEIAPSVPGYATRLAMLFEEKQMYPQAIAYYTDALKKEPSAEVYGRLGTLYLLMEDYEKAIEYFKKGLRFDVQSPALNQNILAAYHRWGVKLIETEQYDKAANILDAALVRYTFPYHPFSYILLYDRAVAYEGAKEYGQAIERYKRVLSVKPDFSPPKMGIASSLNNIGVGYVKLQDYQRAIESYEESLKWDAECWYARQGLEATLLRLGWEKDNAGDLSGAISTYKRILDLNPNSEHAHNNLGIVYYKQNQFDEAIKEFNIALKLNPQFEEAKVNRKWAQSKKGWGYFKPILVVFGILVVSYMLMKFSIKRVEKMSK